MLTTPNEKKKRGRPRKNPPKENQPEKRPEKQPSINKDGSIRKEKSCKMSFETAVQIVALRKAGKTTEETGRLVGISRRTVERFEKDKGKYAMLPNIDNEIKTLLPAHFRKLALVCLKDAMSKSKRASASHRDLMISVGILLDKAILVETGGRDPLKDILAIIQARVDTSEKDRLRELIGTNPDVTEAEVVKPVQPCPDNPPKSNAPKNDKEFPTTTPPWERV